MSWSMIVRCEMIQKGINALTEELAAIDLL
jgi:hypothetical protein